MPTSAPLALVAPPVDPGLNNSPTEYLARFADEEGARGDTCRRIIAARVIALLGTNGAIDGQPDVLDTDLVSTLADAQETIADIESARDDMTARINRARDKTEALATALRNATEALALALRDATALRNAVLRNTAALSNATDAAAKVTDAAAKVTAALDGTD
jgi:uncharacterized phage infection (PIP) family protein YhgE